MGVYMLTEQDLNELVEEVKRGDLSSFQELGVGTTCTCYRHEYHDVVLKLSKFGDREVEDKIFREYSSLGVFPKLYFSSENFSIVSYEGLRPANEAGTKNTKPHAIKLLVGYLHLLKDGIGISDMNSTNNIRYKKSKGFTIIDAGNYSDVSSYTNKEKFNVVCPSLKKFLVKLLGAEEYHKIAMEYLEFKRSHTDIVLVSHLLSKGISLDKYDNAYSLLESRITSNNEIVTEELLEEIVNKLFIDNKQPPLTLSRSSIFQ